MRYFGDFRHYFPDIALTDEAINQFSTLAFHELPEAVRCYLIERQMDLALARFA